MKVDAAYIAVKERKRAEKYWMRVLGTEPVMKNETFTFFNIDGFMFGLFDSSKVGEEIKSGNNCVLNLHVEDADSEMARLSEFSRIVMPIRSVGNYRLFQVEDSEGNTVEFYSTLNNG